MSWNFRYRSRIRRAQGDHEQSIKAAIKFGFSELVSAVDNIATPNRFFVRFITSAEREKERTAKEA